jgi:hypothetical protein
MNELADSTTCCPSLLDWKLLKNDCPMVQELFYTSCNIRIHINRCVHICFLAILQLDANALPLSHSFLIFPFTNFPTFHFISHCPHFALTLPSLCPHYALTMPSFITHIVLTLPSLCPYFALTLPSLCSHFALTLPSLCPNFVLTLPSLCPNIALTMPSFITHFVLTLPILPSLCPHFSN